MFLLTGIASFTVVADHQQKSRSNSQDKLHSDVLEQGTIYGPYPYPYICGDIELTEDASYSSKRSLGPFCIYRDLKLTGHVSDIGPTESKPMSFGLIFRPNSLIYYAGIATITFGLWIGRELPEKSGGFMIFSGTIARFLMDGGVSFNGQLETLE